MPEYPRGNAVTEALIKQRRLSSWDANLARGVQMSPAETAADFQQDMTAGNLHNLVREIARSRDPRTRAILMQELERIKGEMNNLVGPVPQDEAPALQNPLFNPRQPALRPPMLVPKPNLPGGVRG